MEKEIWKNVKGYEGLEHLEISNLGNVRNSKTGNILTPSYETNGYARVYSRLVHRLVALAFIPNPHNLPQVDHINGNRADNRACNLRWVNNSINNQNRKPNQAKTKITYEPYKDEIFKPLKGIPQMQSFGENWEISNYGRFRKTGTKQIREIMNREKYKRKHFNEKGTTKSVCVHKIVAWAFIENDSPATKTQVDHIDGNTHNNHVSNLRWVTPSENQQYVQQRKQDTPEPYNIVPSEEINIQLAFDFES